MRNDFPAKIKMMTYNKKRSGKSINIAMTCFKKLIEQYTLLLLCVKFLIDRISPAIFQTPNILTRDTFIPIPNFGYRNSKIYILTPFQTNSVIFYFYFYFILFYFIF